MTFKVKQLVVYHRGKLLRRGKVHLVKPDGTGQCGKPSKSRMVYYDYQWESPEAPGNLTCELCKR